ncbi:hypothetical protein AWV80_09065 [Cupriavidus sp. UYMU48A]|nr:hypothetical protein AWV80_09065 [Cupriavidus sp. UYMU48A]
MIWIASRRAVARLLDLVERCVAAGDDAQVVIDRQDAGRQAHSVRAARSLSGSARGKVLIESKTSP